MEQREQPQPSKRLNVLLVSEELEGKTNYRMYLSNTEMPLTTRGADIVDQFRRELERLDFAHHLERVEAVRKRDNGFTVRTTSGIEFATKSVILTTGSRIKYLDVPGEQEYFGRGVTYSAISYAPFYIDRHTVVVGDGVKALRAVAELVRVAATVHLVAPTRGDLDSPMGKNVTTAKTKVIVMEGHHVKAIQGNDFVKHIILETPEGKEIKIDTEGIFIELGLLPNSDLVQDLVSLNAEGFVMVDGHNRTSCPGLFAAGDVTNAYVEQALVAVGEGIKAALNAYDYLLTF